MKVVIKNKEGEELAGVLEGNPKDKLTIICHGLASTKDNPTFVRIANELKPSFRFDFSGNGESEGLFEDSTYHKEVEDLKSVLEHFKSKGIKEFCLVGHSMGGGVVQVVAQDQQVKAIISLASVSKADSFTKKFPGLVKEVKETGKSCFFGKKEYPISMKYIDSANTIDIMATAPDVHASALFIQGSDDSTIRADNGKEWLEGLPDDANSMFVELPGLDHRFNRLKPNAKESLQLLIDVIGPWAKTHF